MVTKNRVKTVTTYHVLHQEQARRQRQLDLVEAQRRDAEAASGRARLPRRSVFGLGKDFGNYATKFVIPIWWFSQLRDCLARAEAHTVHVSKLWGLFLYKQENIVTIVVGFQGSRVVQREPL